MKKKRKIEIKLLRPLENEYSLKFQNNHAVDGTFNQLVMRENLFNSDLS